MLRNITLILAILSLSVVAGCKRGEAEPTTPEPEPAATEPAADDEDGVHFEGSRLVIPRKIQFANDSADILPSRTACSTASPPCCAAAAPSAP
jgi:hypothetical protein